MMKPKDGMEKVLAGGLEIHTSNSTNETQLHFS